MDQRNLYLLPVHRNPNEVLKRSRLIWQLLPADVHYIAGRGRRGRMLMSGVAPPPAGSGSGEAGLVGSAGLLCGSHGGL